MRKETTLGTIVWYVISTLIAVVMLFPIYWMFMVSLKLPEEIFKSPPMTTAARPPCSRRCR